MGADSGEEVDGWGPLVAAPPWVAAGGRWGAAGLAWVENGFALAAVEAEVGGGSAAASAGHGAAATAVGGSARGGLEGLGVLPSVGDVTGESSTGVL